MTRNQVYENYGQCGVRKWKKMRRAGASEEMILTALKNQIAKRPTKGYRKPYNRKQREGDSGTGAWGCVAGAFFLFD